MSKTQTMLAEWSKKTGRPVPELQADLTTRMEEIKSLHPQLPENQVIRRARFLVYRDVKAALSFRGELVTFDAICFGYNAAMDIWSRRRREALQAYASNPSLAVEQGFTRPDGTPVYKFAKSGQVIDITKPMLIRQSVLIGRPASGGATKVIVNQHRAEYINNLPPIGTPVRFQVNKRAEMDTKYSTSTIRLTKFDPTTMTEFPTVDDHKLVEILRMAPNEIKATCSNLEAWHKAHQGDRERIVIVEGDVTFMRLEPTSVGNLMFVIEDETIMDLEAEGITVWIDQSLQHLLNFGNGSRVLVIGSTTLMPGFNRETRTIDRSVTRAALNAFGVFADPVFKIEPEEETVFEADASMME